jgi:hypothetical protein
VGGAAVPATIRSKFGSIMSIKVLAFADAAGEADVVPVFGVIFRTPGELRFKVSGYNERARSIEPGSPVALNVLTMELMTYQVKGKLTRFEKHLGMEVGVVRIEEAYSCMPPLVAQRIV